MASGKVLNRNYRESFESWAQVRENFNGYGSDTVAVAVAVPDKEPRFVFAIYDTPPYEGYADVLFSEDGKEIFHASGSHCSCFGLEGQWKPEQMPVEAIIKEADSSWGCLSKFSEEVKRWLKRIQKYES